MEGEKKRAAEAATVSELESESDSESNAAPGREEKLRGASWSSGAERSGVGRKSNPPPRRTTGRKHGRGVQ